MATISMLRPRPGIPSVSAGMQLLPGGPSNMRQPVQSQMQQPVQSQMQTMNNPALGVGGDMRRQVLAQQPQQQATPQFGLVGAEAALQAGLGGGLSAIEQGLGMVGQTLGNANQQANQLFQQGRQDLRSGSAAAQNQLQQSEQSALNQLLGAENVARGDINRAVSGFDPFTQFSGESRQAQAALAGLQGQEAFDQALINDPGQQFIRDQAERALINQSAATGGLQGGRVLEELQQQAAGLAAQDLQNQFNRLDRITGTGLQATGQQANLLNNAANLSANLGQARAGINQQTGAGIANLLQGTGQNLSNLGVNQAQFGGQLAGQLAGIQAGAIPQAANLLSGTGQNIANLRTRAGDQLANQASNVTSNIANLQNQQGSSLANLIGQGGSNIANLLTGFGQADAQTQQQLAQIPCKHRYRPRYSTIRLAGLNWSNSSGRYTWQS